MSNSIYGENLSKLKKGYKPVFVRRERVHCTYGCQGSFRSKWDLDQHYIYAHEGESGFTTLRGINEAVRNIGRQTPLDSHSVTVGAKSRGDWTFVPRSSNSVRPDHRSTKTGNSKWSSGISRMLSVSKKAEQPSSGRSVRSKTISNPIPHESSLAAAERIGADLPLSPRHPPMPERMVIPQQGRASGSRSFIPMIHESPIALEDKDFDSASDSEDDSGPSSPSLVSTPLDAHASLTSEDFEKPVVSGRGVPVPFIRTDVPRPPMPRSPQASFSRPTPSAYPTLLKHYLENQPQSPLLQRKPSFPNAPQRPARPPPVPARSPARHARNSSNSEDGHSRPPAYPRLPSSPLVRKSPSHPAMRF